MKKILTLMTILVFLLVLSVPVNATPIENISNNNALTQNEINSLLSSQLSYDPTEIRVATPEELNRINEKTEEEKKEHPEQPVELHQVLEELNLTDLTIVSEEELNAMAKPQIQPFAVIDAGGIGFESYVRNATFLNAQAHVINVAPFSTINQVAGYIEGFRQFSTEYPTSYVVMFNEYYDVRNIGFGTTKVSTLKSIAHNGLKAKMLMTGVVYVDSETRALTNTIVSNTDGTFTNN